MGEYADDAIDKVIDDVFGYSAEDDRKGLLEDNYDCDVWTMMSMDGIPLHKMTDAHIENAIAHIEEFGPTACFGYGGRWLRKLGAEQHRRSKGNK